MIGGAGAVELKNCQSGNCPRCNSTSRIPDGLYSPVAGIVHDIADWQRLVFSLLELQDLVTSGASISDIRDRIHRDPTVKTTLAKFLPQNLKDIQTLLIIIGMIIAACKVFVSPDPPAQALLPTDVAKALTNSTSARNDSHTTPKEDTPQSTGNSRQSDSQ